MGKKGTLKPINENLINYTKERFSIPGDNYLIRSFRHFYEHGYNFVLSSKHVNPIFIKKKGENVCVALAFIDVLHCTTIQKKRLNCCKVPP